MMHYLYRSGEGSRRRVVHIATHDRISGDINFREALCGMGPFNRAINAPFTLGHKICKKCLSKLESPK